jgi:hypothetical protein
MKLINASNHLISTYKITNYVLDEIDLTCSFNFFTTSAITSNSNVENKELHQRNYISIIVKIYRERGKTLTKE